MSKVINIIDETGFMALLIYRGWEGVYHPGVVAAVHVVKTVRSSAVL